MKKFIVPALAGLSLIFAIHAVMAGRQIPQPSVPISPPPESPYPKYVAGVGLVEANTENIAIVARVSGTVTEVYAKAGDHVRAGDPLFRIDDRDYRANLNAAQADYNLAVANWKLAELRVNRLHKLYETKVSSRDELDVAENVSAVAMASIGKAKAMVDRAEFELWETSIVAPIDGQLLQVKVHRGEYATAGVLDPPLMLIGNTEPMNVRVDVDEQNAWRVRPGTQAVASLRGNSKVSVPLQFVRFEPYVIPKKSLTGDIIERVDTRVLQVIFSLSRDDDRVHLGQQMDVFIDAEGPPRVAASKPGVN